MKDVSKGGLCWLLDENRPALMLSLDIKADVSNTTFGGDTRSDNRAVTVPNVGNLSSLGNVRTPGFCSFSKKKKKNWFVPANMLRHSYRNSKIRPVVCCRGS